MSEPRITIFVEGEVTLTPDELWPDGPPEGWTVGQAADEALQLTTRHRMDLPLTVEVTAERPNPDYHGDAVLFGDPPPQTFQARSTGEVTL